MGNKHNNQFKKAQVTEQSPQPETSPEKVEVVVEEKDSPEEFVSSGGRIQQWQSDEAKSTAIDAQLAIAKANMGEEPKSARVNEIEAVTPVVQVERVKELNKMVMVKPLRTETRVRYGTSWYSFEAGKKCLVPKHLAVVLEQKGLI